MQFLTGVFDVWLGFMVMLFGILLGFTIIGIIWALPVTMFGWGKMMQGMVRMGIGTARAVTSARKSGRQ